MHVYYTIIKKLNLDRSLSNQDNNNTYKFKNDSTKDKIIEKHNLSFLNIIFLNTKLI